MGLPAAANASDLADPIAAHCGYASVVGFPIYDDGTLAEIVVWYF
ncbi:MAG: hypothetical protein AAFR04_06605 [Pseudomonadota bacterium]